MNLSEQSSAAILEFTSIDFAKPTIHWPALSLSSPLHPESPLVLITEPSVFSFSQPSASFDHFTCFTCLAVSVLGSTTRYKNSSLHFHYLHQVWIRSLLFECLYFVETRILLNCHPVKRLIFYLFHYSFLYSFR